MHVVDKVIENETVTSVFVDASEQPSFRNRRPAQFATLQLPRGDGWSEPHPFTIANAPGGDVLRFTIRRVDAFTAEIRDAKVGLPVVCKGPYGSFCADIDRWHQAVLIAGGIGITPFLSVLRNYQATRASHPAITLLWGHNAAEEAFSVEELAALQRGLGIEVIHRIAETSSPAPRWPGVKIEFGLLSAEFLKPNVPPKGAGLYVCGSPNMKAFVMKELATAGVDVTQVKTEVIQWNPPTAKN